MFPLNRRPRRTRVHPDFETGKDRGVFGLESSSKAYSCASMAIGGFGWELGPVVIGSDAQRRSFASSFGREEAVELSAIEDDARLMSLRGQPAILLNGGRSTDIIPLDDKCTVLVRFVKRGDAKLHEPEQVSPWWVPDDGWTPSEGTFDVSGELQVFDLMAQVLAQSEPGEERDYETEKRGERFLTVSLPPGRYEVETADFKAPTGNKLQFVRLRQRGHEPVRPNDVLPVPQVQQLSVTEQVLAQAKMLKFVGHGDGGPTVILPNAVRASWTGIEERDDGSHYELACDSEETFEFEGLDAFCLQEVGSTAVLTVPEGLLLPRWVGADSEAAVLAVALQVSYEPFLRDDAPLLFESKGGRFTLMHAVERGDSPGTNSEFFEFDLPAGKYAVEQMAIGDGVEWTGEVTFPDGSTEDSMVQAYRFRLL